MRMKIWSELEIIADFSAHDPLQAVISREKAVVRFMRSWMDYENRGKTLRSCISFRG